MPRDLPPRERFARHWAILKGRSLHSLPGRAPRRRSLFLHMPKCGGTSLSEAMYATIPFSERIGVIDAVATRRAAAMLHFGEDAPFLCHEDKETGQHVFDLREALLLQHMAWDTMLIHGHVLWSDRAERHFGESYSYVTLLRDPVARMISNYRMTRRSGVVRDGMERYLDSDIARRHARVYLRYLSGRNDIPEAELPGALALAESRLEKFALIGFLDDLAGFVARYREIFGVRLKPARLNAAPERAPDLPPAQLQRITELCAPDIALYEAARRIAGRG